MRSVLAIGALVLAACSGESAGPEASDKTAAAPVEVQSGPGSSAEAAAPGSGAAVESAAIVESAATVEKTASAATPGASDTLLAVTSHGAVLTPKGGPPMKISYRPDNTFTLDYPQQKIEGSWRIAGDELCTISTSNPAETCTTYPRGKKSGDEFPIMSATLGPLTVRIN